MSGPRGDAERLHVPWALLLVLVGALTVLVSAGVGFTWLNRMPDLQPVDFGQQAQVRAQESTSATIYASTGMSRPPSCTVSPGTGELVTVGDAQDYHQAGGLESAGGFLVTAGTTYTVTCRSEAGDGRFAVAQDAAVPEGIFIAAGSLGLAMCGVGGLLAFRRQQE